LWQCRLANRIEAPSARRNSVGTYRVADPVARRWPRGRLRAAAPGRPRRPGGAACNRIVCRPGSSGDGLTTRQPKETTTVRRTTDTLKVSLTTRPEMGGGGELRTGGGRAAQYVPAAMLSQRIADKDALRTVPAESVPPGCPHRASARRGGTLALWTRSLLHHVVQKSARTNRQRFVACRPVPGAGLRLARREPSGGELATRTIPVMGIVAERTSFRPGRFTMGSVRCDGAHAFCPAQKG